MDTRRKFRRVRFLHPNRKLKPQTNGCPQIFATNACPQTVVHKTLSQTSVHKTLSTNVCPQTAVRKTLSTNFYPQTFVHKRLSTNCCPQKIVHKVLSFSVHKLLSTNVCAQTVVHKTLSTNFCPPDRNGCGETQASPQSSGSHDMCGLLQGLSLCLSHTDSSRCFKQKYISACILIIYTYIHLYT